MNAGAPEVAEAVAVLRRGGVVAFPTETVYGLGADATHAAAVARIFQIKGRPPTNPLIVHVADAATACRYAREWPLAASQLAQRFWPGPLTLVLPKSASIVPAVTAGLDTVGLRVPDHRRALQLLREFGGPVAAPSANRSNQVSPTTAQHVREELGDAVDLILDGGPCNVGIESTVLDLTSSRPTVLRPGGVTREQIEAVVGPVELSGETVRADESARSPGRHPVHYAPRSPAFRFPRGQIREAIAALHRIGIHGPKALLSFPGGNVGWGGYPDIPMPAEPEAYARDLYAALRQVDRTLAELPAGRGTILIEMPPEGPEWIAVRDRIVRATRPL